MLVKSHSFAGLSIIHMLSPTRMMSQWSGKNGLRIVGVGPVHSTKLLANSNRFWCFWGLYTKEFQKWFGYRFGTGWAFRLIGHEPRQWNESNRRWKEVKILYFFTMAQQIMGLVDRKIFSVTYRWGAFAAVTYACYKKTTVSSISVYSMWIYPYVFCRSTNSGLWSKQPHTRREKAQNGRILQVQRDLSLKHEANE